MQPIRNRIRCATCDRDVPFAGDAQHVVSLVPDPVSDAMAIEMQCTAKKAPWYQRVWQWFW